MGSVGHLTQLLWTNTTEVGCAVAKAIPSIYDSGMLKRGMVSSYLVCHYKTLGNVVTQMLDNYQPLRTDLCTTFGRMNGRNECIPEGLEYSRFVQPKVSGQCMGLNAEYNRCECHADNSKVIIPLCKGKCLVQCRNVWNSSNFNRKECTGHQFCTCSRDGAVCV